LGSLTPPVGLFAARARTLAISVSRRPCRFAHSLRTRASGTSRASGGGHRWGVTSASS